MVEWMKTQVLDGVTYYDRWIKPMEGLNTGTVYAGRPPGNGPELMPWDASLNQDVDCAAGRQASVCVSLRCVSVRLPVERRGMISDEGREL